VLDQTSMPDPPDITTLVPGIGDKPVKEADQPDG
jgi:hypothetical protein